MSTISSHICVYNNCFKRRYLYKDITFFSFPVKDSKRAEEWKKNCGNINIALMDVADLKNKLICEEHFMPKDIIIGSKRKLLSKSAIPIEFIEKDKKQVPCSASTNLEQVADAKSTSNESFITRLTSENKVNFEASTSGSHVPIKTYTRKGYINREIELSVQPVPTVKHESDIVTENIKMEENIYDCQLEHIKQEENLCVRLDPPSKHEIEIEEENLYNYQLGHIKEEENLSVQPVPSSKHENLYNNQMGHIKEEENLCVQPVPPIQHTDIVEENLYDYQLEHVKEEENLCVQPDVLSKHEIKILEENLYNYQLGHITEEENLGVHSVPSSKHKNLYNNQLGHIEEKENPCVQLGCPSKHEIEIVEENAYNYQLEHVKEEENLCVQPVPLSKYELEIENIEVGENLCVQPVLASECKIEIDIKEEDSLQYQPEPGYIKEEENLYDQPGNSKEKDNLCVQRVSHVEHEIGIGDMDDDDTVKFIEEIGKRRAIWDTSKDITRSSMKEQWEEVVDLFGGEQCISNKEKRALAITLQKRWKNIRYCYTREKRLAKTFQSGSGVSKRTQYRYYNNLLFLNNVNSINETETNISNNCDEDSHQPIPEESTIVEDPYSGLRHSHIKKRRNDDSNGEELLQVLKEAAIAKEARKVRKLKPNTETDDDTLFLLSLYSDFKKVPEYLKMQTKMEIMQVIQRAVSNHKRTS